MVMPLKFANTKCGDCKTPASPMANFHAPAFKAACYTSDRLRTPRNPQPQRKFLGGFAELLPDRVLLCCFITVDDGVELFENKPMLQRSRQRSSR